VPVPALDQTAADVEAPTNVAVPVPVLLSTAAAIAAPTNDAAPTPAAAHTPVPTVAPLVPGIQRRGRRIRFGRRLIDGIGYWSPRRTRSLAASMAVRIVSESLKLAPDANASRTA
jgi:hypothetical protein